MKQLLVILFIGVLLFVSCAAPEETDLLPELSVPTSYITYTNEADYFSISYPPDWDVNWSLIEDTKFQEYMESRYSGTDIDSLFSATLFLAGIPTGKGGYSPNTVVSVIPTPRDGMSLENIVDEMIGSEKTVLKEYELLLRVGTTNEGREAIIKETKSFQSNVGSQQLQMITLKDKNIWVLTSTSSPEDFAKYEDDFYYISYSLQLLR